MATKKMRSIKGRAARFTRLDICGAPVHAARSYVVTQGFITVTISENVEAGGEITQKNAWGEFCIDEKDPDILKWAGVKIELCEVDPDIMDIVGGSNPVFLAGNTIGWTRGPLPPEGGFAIEVWTKKAGVDACVAPPTYTVTNKALTTNVATLTIGTHTILVGDTVVVSGVDATFDGTFTVTGIAATTISYAKVAANVVSAAATGTVLGESKPEWGYFLVPFIKNPKLDGDIVIANAPLNVTLSGEGYGAPAAWGMGPHADQPFLVTFPVGEMYGGVVTTVQPPDPTNGAATLV